MRGALLAAVAAVAVLGAACDARAAGLITGSARDLQGQPINGVPFQLFLDNGNPPVSGRTGADGSFNIPIPDGTVTVVLVFGGIDGTGLTRTNTPFALKSGETHNLTPVVRLDTDPTYDGKPHSYPSVVYVQYVEPKRCFLFRRR